MSALATAAITGGASLLGSVFSSLFGAKSAANLNVQNRRWQEQMYSQQLQDSIDMWNETNAYNSPVQQMQRLKEAGLNPNLIYSNNANMPAGSLTAPSPGSPSTTVPQLDLSGLFQFADFMQRAELQKSTLQTMQVQRDAADVQMKKGLAEINNIIAQNPLIQAQTKRQLIDNNFMTATFSDRVKQMANAAKLSEVQIALSHLDQKEREYRINEILPLQKLQLGIQNEAARVGISMTNAQIRNLAASTQNAFLQGKLLNIDYQWQNLLRSKYGLDPHSPWYVSSYASGGLMRVVADTLKPWFTNDFGDSNALGVSPELNNAGNFIMGLSRYLPGANLPFAAKAGVKIYKGLQQLISK